MKLVEVDGKTYYETEFGDLTFRVPQEFHDPSHTPSSLGFFLGWPGPQVVHGYGQPDLRHFIHLVVGNSPEPIRRFPDGDSSASIQAWVRSWQLTGPHMNESLGLLEYREVKEPHAALFLLSPDATYVQPDGQRPYVQCSPTVAYGWDNARQCRTDSHLSPRVYYHYTFSDALLPEWSKIDAAIRAFLMSMTVPAQQGR